MLGIGAVAQLALGQLPSSSSLITLNCGTGSFSLTGVDANLFGAVTTLNCGTGAFAVTGENAGLAHNYTLDAGTGAFSLTSASVDEFAGYTLSCGTGAFTVQAISTHRYWRLYALVNDAIPSYGSPGSPG